MVKKKLPVLQPFNPLQKGHLAKSAARALLISDVQPLPPEPFIAAGVYALYYQGDFPAYRLLVEKNRDGSYEWPIYVGKAVPEGSRKGGTLDNIDPGTVLYKRLLDHAKSIEAADNLDLADFRCRYLSVDDIWIPLTENMLIEKFRPVWNRILDGFGNHDPGKGRLAGKRSSWDCVHPGRAWADQLQPSMYTEERLMGVIEKYLKQTLTSK